MRTNNIASNADLRLPDIQTVLDELMAIRVDMVSDVAKSRARLDRVDPNFCDSARNLLHYLAIRRRDLRPLQLRLAALGFSSLGRAESHVLATVDAVLAALHRLAGTTWQPPHDETAVVDFASGERLLAEHAEGVLGASTPGRGVRIMVPMPSEAADDYALVHNLLQEGMNCMRINCAHDDSAAWLQMIEHLRRAEPVLTRTCRVVMDLAGPKLRTGPIEPGPAVLRIKPKRDVCGRVISAAKVYLTSEDSPYNANAPRGTLIPVPAKWLARLRIGATLQLTDARGAKRTLTVVEVGGSHCVAEAMKTTYIVPGTVLIHDQKGATKEEREAAVGGLPPIEGTIFLQQCDLLVLTRNLNPGRAATIDPAGQTLTPAEIGCTMPEVFDDICQGESIWFDDGKIGGFVEKIGNEHILVRITQARLKGEKLRADKGINLPETGLRLSALTAKDVEDLSFVAHHADVVELSFANTPQDVELLQQHLTRLGGPLPAIVLKIETRRGFEHLPDMLLTAMQAPRCGVMIARGDLAVECGFERLA